MHRFDPYLLAGCALGLVLYMRRAAGRLAPKAAFAPILFLVTRKAVLIGWAVGAVGMFTLIWRSAVSNGHDPSQNLLLLTGISLFCGLGFAALVVGPGFMLYRLFQPKPVFAPEPGETVLKEQAGNHFLGGEGRGGKLRVTNRRLVFTPHRFNVQLEPFSARLEELAGLKAEGARFLVVDVKGMAEPQWVVVWNPDAFAEYLARLAALPEAERTAARP